MNIFPKSVFRGTNSDGVKFSANEYDYSTYANICSANFFVYLLFGALFSGFVAPIVLLVSILSFNGRFNLIYVLGIIFSGYFLYDCYHGWVILLLLSFICNGSTGTEHYWFIDLLVSINIAVLITITALIVFGRPLFYWINEKIENYHSKLAYLFGFVLLIFVFGCIKGNTIVNKDKDWVTKALKLGDYNDSPNHLRLDAPLNYDNI